MSQSVDHQEREWLVGLRAGSLDVFRTLFTTYETQLHYFACLWVPSAEAEDIVQDVFFDLWQRRAALSISDGSLKTYLFSAVRNRIRNYIRHDTIVHRAHQSSSDNPPAMSPGPRAPDASLVAEELRGQIAEAMVSLSEIQRAVLMLRWTQDMSFAQIAATLSISENAARLHASRGRQALQAVLRDVLDE